MSGIGVLSKNFTVFVENATAAPFTIGAFGFQYEIIGVRVTVSGGASVVAVRQTNAGGAIIATRTTPAGADTYFITLDATRANRQITAVGTPIYIDPGANSTQIVLECIGIQGVTPPALLDGVSALTITT